MVSFPGPGDDEGGGGVVTQAALVSLQFSVCSNHPTSTRESAEETICEKRPSGRRQLRTETSETDPLPRLPLGMILEWASD